MMFACDRCGLEFDQAEDRNEHRFACRAIPAEAPKKKPTGTTLEALVRVSLKSLRHAGLVVEQNAPRAVGHHGRGGRFAGRVLGKGGLDFSGDFKGRAVYFDAKSCATTALPLRNLKKHQVERVKNSHDRGAVAFFLVEMTGIEGAPRYFALAWPVLKSFWLRRDQEDGARSIPLATLIAHCPEVTRAGRLIDLIGAVRAVEARKDGGVA